MGYDWLRGIYTCRVRGHDDSLTLNAPSSQWGSLKKPAKTLHRISYYRILVYDTWRIYHKVFLRNLENDRKSWLLNVPADAGYRPNVGLMFGLISTGLSKSSAAVDLLHGILHLTPKIPSESDTYRHNLSYLDLIFFPFITCEFKSISVTCASFTIAFITSEKCYALRYFWVMSPVIQNPRSWKYLPWYDWTLWLL